MSSQENNIVFQKTSFLSGTNSSYIEKLYAKYVENPASIPDSWRQFFEGLGDQKDNIIENQEQLENRVKDYIENQWENNLQ